MSDLLIFSDLLDYFVLLLASRHLLYPNVHTIFSLNQISMWLIHLNILFSFDLINKLQHISITVSDYEELT
jgi:hypothetical protein